MPLHDWAVRTEWEGVYLYWMGEIAQWLKSRLPPGYRAVIGASPYAHLGVAIGKPDVSVTNGSSSKLGASAPPSPAEDALEPDFETVVTTLEEDRTLLVKKSNVLVAAVEIISPANKDRPERRDRYTARYLGYLREGVHLLLVDVHARPAQFSFAARIAVELPIDRQPPPAPQAVSYRVGAVAPFGGRFLGVWQRALAIGSPLPSIPLAISADDKISIDLEATYIEAARKAYVEG